MQLTPIAAVCRALINLPPSQIHAQLNYIATGLKSDPYALVQKFPTDTSNNTR